MKVVYVFISGSNDTYYEQLMLSIHSLKKFNRDVSVSVVCDNATYDTLVGDRSEIKDIANVIVTNVSNELKSNEKAYYIKSNLRSIVDGDFLFLDTDTIVLSDLSGIKDIEGDVLAVKNRHVGFPLNGLFVKSQNEIPKYNSGVLYIRDTERARTLCSVWNRLLNENTDKRDEVSLLNAQKETSILVTELGGVWNCQVASRKSKDYITDAKVVHMFYMSGLWMYFDIRSILGALKDKSMSYDNAFAKMVEMLHRNVSIPLSLSQIIKRK